jgi:hypothetical protein
MRLTSLKIVRIIALSLCAVSLARGTDVQDADKFALGGIGVAGTMSKRESALRTILDRRDAAGQLEKMLPHATNAGRLYILVGLRMRDRSGYKRAFDLYSQHDSTVETVVARIPAAPFAVPNISHQTSARQRVFLLLPSNFPSCA